MRKLALIRPWLPLFIMSSLSLYMELAVIRWLAGEIRILAYFKNLPLLAAFLGLSIGFALVKRGHDYRLSFTGLWVMLVGLTLVIGQVTKTRLLAFPSRGEVALWYVAPVDYWVSLVLFIGVMAIFFFAGMLLFIPLGQATGMEMQKHSPVPAYIVNILASLVGVWAFSLVSFLQTPPVLWFLIGLIGIIAYFIYLRQVRWWTIAIFVVTLIGIYVAEPDTIWSPYNRLDLAPAYAESDGQRVETGVNLTVQHVWYQSAIDLSDEFILDATEKIPEAGEQLALIAESYNLPYELASPGSQVVVVGSGMGNNVAAALRSGMGHVDAVEIDPAIAELGLQYHPEQPYSDPRVNVIVDDARSFFNTTQNQYDLVVFGLLDSHTLLSGFSSVRLDSFVYTLESFEQAKSLLKEDGYMVITFAANNDWIRERLGRMMIEVFGQGNVFMYKGIRDTTFVGGENPVQARQLDQVSTWQPNPEYEDLSLTTDDWPYIYMQAKRIPAGYWQTLLAIGVMTVLLMRRTFPESLRPDWKFFLLGVAFLLIEFKSITELALLFGTTWFVNSLAISGVLVMALLANIYVLKARHVNLNLCYLLLFASLGVGFFFRLDLLTGMGPMVRGLLGSAILTIPLLFAGVIFSTLLKRTGETAGPIASNFAGSAVGGVMEYGSIWWGIKGLYVIALFTYVAAAIISLRRREP